MDEEGRIIPIVEDDQGEGQKDPHEEYERFKEETPNRRMRRKKGGDAK